MIGLGIGKWGYFLRCKTLVPLCSIEVSYFILRVSHVEVLNSLQTVKPGT